MSKLILLSLLLLLPLELWAAKDICEVLKLSKCPAVVKQSRRSSMQALPSTATASNLNPANVSLDRGVGVEYIYHPSNSGVVNFLSGTGKVGGAFVSSSVENGFFGNRTVETDQKFLDRNQNNKHYRSNKINLAAAARLLGKGANTLDVGLMFKRHNEIKDINLGVGAAARLGFLTLGASVYQDDFIIYQKDKNMYDSGRGYDLALTGNSLSEKFTVQTLSAGLRYNDFGFDYGSIRTQYKQYGEASTIELLAFSYAYKKVLFNVARRSEKSPAPKFEDNKLVYRDNQTNYFASFQVAIGEHFIVGTSYNYFLLREMSFNAMFFF